MYGAGSSPESYTATIPGWFNPAAANASLRKRATNEGSRARSLRNTFTATSRARR
ncbi:unannotated protein [freshwater metagenome]|uniref:Unannotated protein n=1 Tax=freshwater metagenome TaxID=449393 RepID=A0A6J6ZBJ3_9ZZZZ